MTHVFSLEAMATCEQRGHSFAWVATWHDVGFDECTRCGLSLGARSASTAILPGATVDAPETSGFATSTEGAKPDIACAPAAGEQLAGKPLLGDWCGTNRPDMPQLRRRPAVAGRPRNAAMALRDQQIRLRIAAGESHRAVAAAYGIHQTRVTQILRGGAPAKGRQENAARDADIRRRVAGGESVAAIAAAFGISQQRVYQIAPAWAGDRE